MEADSGKKRVAELRVTKKPSAKGCQQIKSVKQQALSKP
jgi:hypothetical protein